MEFVQVSLALVGFDQVEDGFLVGVYGQVDLVEVYYAVVERRQVVEVLVCQDVLLVDQLPELTSSFLNIAELGVPVHPERGHETTLLRLLAFTGLL